MSNNTAVSPFGPPVDILFLKSDEHFAAVQQVVKDAIWKTACLHLYNTLDTFAWFHQAFRSQDKLTLEQFTKISPVIHDENSLSCVGLSYKVMKYITESEPGLARYLHLVICTDYDNETPNPRNPPTPEQAFLFDHLLMVLQFCLNGRLGYMVADNALLVDFPIVIMVDNQPPHTGYFRSLSREGYRENNVQIVNQVHAVWKITEVRPDQTRKQRKRVIYLGKQFLEPDAIERRAKLIPFHGCILMGKGGFKAGLFQILGNDNRRFTLSVPDEKGQTVSVRFPYEYLCLGRKDREAMDAGSEVESALEVFSKLCGFEDKETLIQRFGQVSEACRDTEFIDETIRLDKKYFATLKAAALDSALQ